MGYSQRKGIITLIFKNGDREKFTELATDYMTKYRL